MVTWTSREQSTLDALQRKRDEFMQMHRTPLVTAIYRLQHVPEMAMAEEIAGIMIQHADKFRDLLEPFDSGGPCFLEV